MVKPLRSFSPIYANVEYFLKIFALAENRSWRHKWRALWLRPGQDLEMRMSEIPEVSAETFHKFRGAKWGTRQNTVACILFVFAFVFAYYLLAQEASLSAGARFLLGALTIFCSAVMGRMLAP